MSSPAVQTNIVFAEALWGIAKQAMRAVERPRERVCNLKNGAERRMFFRAEEVGKEVSS